MTILEVIQRSTEFLAKKNVDSPRLQVELLLAHVLKMPRMKLYLNFEQILGPADLETLRELVRRRGQREPLQHILGTVSFCGLELSVNKNVLVPRPETEVLAERAWKFLAAFPAQPSPRALDLGTGSGCLAIAMAIHAPNALVTAVDISDEALVVARENAARLQVLERIEFHKGDMLQALSDEDQFALIVSNPPYIPTAEMAALDPEVRDFDPRLALDGGPDGLDFYRRIAAGAAPFLQAGGKVMVELNDGGADLVSSLFDKHGWRVDAVEPDLNSRPRILIASPPPDFHDGAVSK
jgi:release factor glutamine methyltransferase